MTQQIILTPEGVKKLKEELLDLKKNKRRDISERIKSAKEYGDLSENAEYQEAKQEQGFIEGRILEIDHILRIAHIATKSITETVEIGSKVTVHNGSSEITYEIVGATESDPMGGKISFESPLGEALIGKKVGESLEIKTPLGVSKYVIKKIT